MSLRGTTRRSLVFLLVVVFLSPAAAGAGAEQPWQWDDVSRVVAFGDVHGAHDRLVYLLTQAGILDAEQNWAGGEAHLVSVGDLLDRGPDSRRVLDLLMRLEGEAARDGGRVHLVLGNHEVMNLVGDLRYVSDEEYLAFADDELPADREQAWSRFTQSHAGADSPEQLGATFEERYPPGYFGLIAAFAPDGHYGSWLLDRNVLVRVDGTAFVHGGLSRVVNGLDGAELNRLAMDQLREYLTLVGRFVELGLLAPETGYKDRGEVIRQAIDDRDGNSRSAPGLPSGKELNELGRRFFEVSETALVFDSDGPLWYRETADGEAETETRVPRGGKSGDRPHDRRGWPDSYSPRGTGTADRHRNAGESVPRPRGRLDPGGRSDPCVLSGRRDDPGTVGGQRRAGPGAHRGRGADRRRNGSFLADGRSRRCGGGRQWPESNGGPCSRARTRSSAT